MVIQRFCGVRAQATCAPIGFSPGKYWSAMLFVITATGVDLSASPSSKTRPAITGICIVEKYFGLASCDEVVLHTSPGERKFADDASGLDTGQALQLAIELRKEVYLCRDFK